MSGPLHHTPAGGGRLHLQLSAAGALLHDLQLRDESGAAELPPTFSQSTLDWRVGRMRLTHPDPLAAIVGGVLAPGGVTDQRAAFVVESIATRACFEDHERNAVAAAIERLIADRDDFFIPRRTAARLGPELEPDALAALPLADRICANVADDCGLFLARENGLRRAFALQLAFLVAQRGGRPEKLRTAVAADPALVVEALTAVRDACRQHRWTVRRDDRRFVLRHAQAAGRAADEALNSMTHQRRSYDALLARLGERYENEGC